MTKDEVLELLIKNMKTQQDNMDYLISGVNEKIVNTLNSTSPQVQFDKKDIIISILSSEEYLNAKLSTYKEVQEWAEAMLKAEEDKQ